MSNHSNIDQDDILWELNNEKAKLFIPAIVYVGILMILGTFGNFVVLYFYGHKTKPTPSTGFIVALAVFDVISCLVGMPMEIADLRFHYNFKSVVACKILRSVTHFASIGSGLTLVIIAVDRYRRICRPFQRQLNRKHVKFACVIIGIMAAVLSWPAALFNTPVEVEVENNYNIIVKGRDCTTSKEDSLQIYIFVFNVVYLLLFVLITSILSVLYTFVGRQLYRHKKFRFYVAKKRAKARKIRVSQAPNVIPEEELLSPQNGNPPSNQVFEDPPDACEPVVDMKEYVTRGMTQVDDFRPGSNDIVVAKTITVSESTRLQNKSKSLKSVTICDPSLNQIISIEPQESTKKDIDLNPSGQSTHNTNNPSVGDNDKDINDHTNLIADQYQNDGYDMDTFSLPKARPISASSFATFSSRPSSASISNLGDNEEDAMYTGDLDEEEFDFPNLVTQRDITITASSYSRNSGDIAENNDDALDDSEIKIQRHPVDLRLEKEKTYVSIPDETIDRSEDGHAMLDSPRPISQVSGESKSSKASSRLRRLKRNTITPVSSVDSSVISSTATVTTLTSSVASRASTVKRFKRLFKHSWKGGKMDTDTDNIKDLRTKMLDINTIKYTMIMITVTVVFVFSFLPYLCLVIWRYYQSDDAVNNMSDAELVLFKIGLRSIFLQSSVNPIIYGGFNSKFRAFFYSTFCRCCTLKRKPKKITKKPRDHSDSTSAS